MKIGVCLACYNGSNYIVEQIESILNQIGQNDVLCISDDSSTDDTVLKVQGINDKRIILHINSENIGYVLNFQNTLSMLQNCDYIFFSDQDDIWVSNRVKLMIETLKESNKNILFGTYDVIDRSISNSVIHVPHPIASSNLNNILGLFLGLKQYPYYGCTSVITSKAKNYIFPIPFPGVGHDIWIALIGNIKDDIIHMNRSVTIRRIHGENLTNSNRNLYSKIKTRIIWSASLFKYYLKQTINGR